MVKNFSKYNYPNLARDDSSDVRLYKTPKGDFVPSVTTIIGATMDTTGLDNWRARVGEERAEAIRVEAARVGTSMHAFLESYASGVKRDYVPSPVHSQASKMADVIVREGLKYIDEIWGSEVQLYYEDKYAGTTDLAGMYKKTPHIIDFKQTNKPKKEEWVENYYLQLAAYINAHNYLTESNIQNGVILMCSRDLQFQKFEMNEIMFQKYSYMWFNRVREYQKLN